MPTSILKKIALICFIPVMLISKVNAQSILGFNTCVPPGVYLGPYTITGVNWSTSDKWCVTGGTINSTGNSCINNSGAPSIGITWNTGITTGTVSYYLAGATNPVTTLTVYMITVNNSISAQMSPYNYPYVPSRQLITASITGSDASTNSCGLSVTYSWQISTDNNQTYTNITGVNTKDYLINSSFTQTIDYRRVATLHGVAGTNTDYSTYSNPLPFIPSAPVNGSVISPQNITIEPNTAPATPFTIQTPASGGSMCSGSYNYTWQTSPDNVNWTTVGSGSSYTPGSIAAKTYVRQLAQCGSMIGISNVAVVNLYLPLDAGMISPMNITVPAGTSPGMLTGTPAANGNPTAGYTYLWLSSTSTDVRTFSTASSANGPVNGLNYTPVNPTARIYYMRQVTCGDNSSAYSNMVTINVGTATTGNYIQSRTITCSNITTPAAADALTSPGDVKQSTTYYDGLGRPIQTVLRQGSLITGNSPADLVTVTQYDAVGNEPLIYLPYVSASTDGSFQTNALPAQNAFNNGQFPGENFSYSQVAYEPSPLRRVNSTSAPGTNWAGSNRSIQSRYESNTSLDAVRIWDVTNSGSAGVFGSYTSSKIYPAGSLYKTMTTDENGNQVIEFKDLDGKVILKKVQLTAAADDGSGSGYTGWLSTYYIYDVLNNLRAVIQPAGVAALTGNSWILTTALLYEQCFRYEYDARNRMIMKKVPGATESYMVYDVLDRLVMTQDANLRAAGEWQVTVYDNFDRPVQTGLLTDNTPFATELSNAYHSPAYPVTGSNFGLLTQTHYDNYNSIPAGLSGGLSTTGGWNSQFSATSNTNYPYPVMPAQNSTTTTMGLVTWTQAKIIGSNPAIYLSTANIYDDKGRLIQTQSQNVSTGVDVTTTQYSWAGQPLMTVQAQQKAGNNLQTTVTVSQATYDVLGRVIQTQKKISNTLVNNNALTAYVTTALLQYDALGRLQQKQLGDQRNAGGTYGTTPLETLNYDYNICGWLLGVNRAYLRDAGSTNYSTNVNTTISGESFTEVTGAPYSPGTNYFGFDLGYDKTNNNLISGGSYAAAQYNGNITGMVWKNNSDGRLWKYDFTYDAVNRLVGADFNQYTGSNFTKTAVDYSVSNLSYDANGNILTMSQKGLKPAGTSDFIDQLTYSYQSGSNKLQQVTDAKNDNTSTLGDFKYNAATKTSTDYTYDANGNLLTDVNKQISNIQYNYLNLPQVITVSGKGTITYTYDAAGNKLQKTTVDNTVNPAKTTVTTYIDGLVYQNDVLQLIMQEEGRIRIVGTTGYVFDYFLKDHLGNTRMVITDDPAASSPILEATNYYPFGLTMAGISSLTTGTPENKYKFNDGSELQHQEFSDGSGLEWYDATFRMYDPQIGRFGQIDALSEIDYATSPFVYSNNNPVLLNDPLGLASDSTDKKGEVWHGLPDVEVTSNTKVLDTKNGQVLPSLSWWQRALANVNGRPWGVGIRRWQVNNNGYLTGMPYHQLNEFAFTAPVDRVPLLNIRAVFRIKNFLQGRYVVYKGLKNGLTYIGKAKGGIELRYTASALSKYGIETIEGLGNLPNNAVALGVEQLVIDLNGGIGTGALANINNATVKEIYINEARTWLDSNMPNWEYVLKF
jgi:RHS repeat-associated protein